MSTENKIIAKDFETTEIGTRYKLPKYTVVDGVGIQKTGDALELDFVRGSKLAGENVPKVDGVLHESLLAMQIADLKYKTQLVPSEDTAYAIVHLEAALTHLENRSAKREKAGVLGTYKTADTGTPENPAQQIATEIRDKAEDAKKTM